MTKVKVTVATEDGELLDMIAIIDETRTPEQLARALIDHVEAKFETEPE
jgi:hypothetical protein